MKRLFILIALTTLILACNLMSPQPATPPEITISSDPAVLSPYSDVTLHIRAKNTGQADWVNCNLLIGYAKKDSGESMFSIHQVPVNLPAGQTLEQEIPWRAEIHDSAGAYEWRLVLVDDRNIQLAATKTPFEFNPPVIVLGVTPAELSASTPANVRVEINNHNGGSMENLKLSILAARHGEAGGILLWEIPVTINAGYCFTREFEWISDIPLADGVYDVQAVLMTDPGSVQIQQASVTVTVKN